MNVLVHDDYGPIDVIQVHPLRNRVVVVVAGEEHHSSTIMTLSWRMTRFGDVTVAVDDEMTSVKRGWVGRPSRTSPSCPRSNAASKGQQYGVREVWKNVPRVDFFLPRYVFKRGGKGQTFRNLY